MTHKERYFAVLAGQPLDAPAFFPDITDWYSAMRTTPGRPRAGGSGALIPDDSRMHAQPGPMPERFADWTCLDFYRRFDWGLPAHVYNWFDEISDGVERTSRTEGNRQIIRLSCPAGELEKVRTMAADGSWAPTTHYVKSIADLDVLRYVVERTRYEPAHDRVEDALATIGEMGVPDITLMRSPFGKLVHEYMGFEQVVYALADEPQVLLDFMDLQEKIDIELARLAADSPAKVVILSDHADENLISPTLYREFCIPHYRKVCDILHAAGKVVSTHLDGNFKGYLPFIGETGFDLLDGCTPAPMMNYEVEELAEALPESMACYLGVPATLFCQGLPDSEILDFGRRILDAFGGRVLLNVGDILPPNADINQLITLGEMVKGWRV